MLWNAALRALLLALSDTVFWGTPQHCGHEVDSVVSVTRL
jgi:hypothetical protein